MANERKIDNVLKVLKASAGSGKTYRLTMEYLKIVLLDPDPRAYRHILAVTFTNKATEEMKSRILSQLYVLAADPEHSKYLNDFLPYFDSVSDIAQKAHQVLTDILHDYSAFAVSTIDKFFQQALRAFSREIGQAATYQVELDRKSLVNETVDRIMDSITEDDKAILDWLVESAAEQLESGKKLDFQSSLYEIAERLKSQEFREQASLHNINNEDAYSMSTLGRLKKGCKAIIKAFEDDVISNAQGLLKAVADEGLSYPSSRGSLEKACEKWIAADRKGMMDPPSAKLGGMMQTLETCFAKAQVSKLSVLLRGSYDDCRAALNELFTHRYAEYVSAYMLLDQANSLAIASRLTSEFNALQKEKNVLDINESTAILKDIIDGSDAPFVYEKMGVYYHHFMLDEFQDTSREQWENFLPLLKESRDNGNYDLIVGDIKQSIYRFRGGDWKLLAHDVKAEFADADDSKPLTDNWRSLRNVVSFNNRFFEVMPPVLDKSFAGCNIEGFPTLKEIYSSARQDPRSDSRQDGCIKCTFCADGDVEKKALVESIRNAKSKGAQWSDIAILVSMNNIGAEVASTLIAEGIPVVSDEALRLRSSVTVMRLAALLSSMCRPDEKIDNYLANLLEVHRPETYYSIVDLAENFLRALKAKSPETFEGEIPYIQAFMDFMSEWVTSNGNNLQGFLDAWDEKDLKLSSPSGTDAVSIMTIHKAKGLEFDHVIVPFIEKNVLFKSTGRWLKPQVKGTGLEEFSNALYDIPMSEKTALSLFGDEYYKEKFLQTVDRFNGFYVALTRASKSLHVIGKYPSRKFLEALGKGDEHELKDFSQVMWEYLSRHIAGAGIRVETEGLEALPSEVGDRESITLVMGEEYDFALGRKENEEKNKGAKEADRRHEWRTLYPSIPLNPGVPVETLGEDGAPVPVGERGRLKFSCDSADFFSDDGASGMEASSRVRGIVYHNMLSTVSSVEDVGSVAEKFIAQGVIDRDECSEIVPRLKSLVQSGTERGWFGSGVVREFNETAVIGVDGREHRPDRVVCNGNGTVIIDYKTGAEEPYYQRQVARYVKLYEEMGYENVSGYIWYIFENKVVKVK